MDKWDRILSPSNVLVGVKAQRKFEAIRELAQVLADHPSIGNHKAFIVSLIRREKRGVYRHWQRGGRSPYPRRFNSAPAIGDWNFSPRYRFWRCRRRASADNRTLSHS